MKEIVLNECYGGFSLSKAGEKLYQDLGGTIPDYPWDYDRSDPILIKVIKALGEKADGPYTALYIKQIDEKYEYSINDYCDDGYESLRLYVEESELRKLIKAGDEEAIVEYVMGAQE